MLILFCIFSSPIALANTAPAFSLDGNKGVIASKDNKGKVVYIDFWASWCLPCRKSFPWMQELQSKYKKHGLKVVAINLDEDRTAANAFLEKMDIDFDIAFDTNGATANAYKVIAMPSSYVINKQGVIVNKHLGFRSRDKQQIEASIRKQLGLN
jgi:thiol-disulfide isomerase/thioredoxin